jgi:hypothetical protein
METMELPMKGQESVKENERNPGDCACGETSTKGCHGVKNGEVYSEYYCDGCYNKKDKE